MGNCVTSNRIFLKNEKDEQTREAEAIESKLEPGRHVDGGKKKIVRFKPREEEDGSGKESHGCSKGGAVRITVVLTQGELIQILRKESKYSSVEQVLSAMKLKSRKVSQVRTSDGGTNGGWRPALESIPEDH